MLQKTRFGKLKPIIKKPAYGKINRDISVMKVNATEAKKWPLNEFTFSLHCFFMKGL